MKRALLWILAIVVTMVILLMTLAFVTSIFLFRTRKGSPDLERVESYTRITFPPGTRVVNGYYEGVQDYNYYVVLEIDASQTEKFLKSLGDRGPTEVCMSREDRYNVSDDDVRVHGVDMSWWTPDAVNKFIAVQAGNASFIIDMGAKSRRRVYLYAYNI